MRCHYALPTGDGAKLRTRFFFFLDTPASLAAIASACALVVTLAPELDLSVPRLNSPMTFSNLALCAGDCLAIAVFLNVLADCVPERPVVTLACGVKAVWIAHFSSSLALSALISVRSSPITSLSDCVSCGAEGGRDGRVSVPTLPDTPPSLCA